MTEQEKILTDIFRRIIIENKRHLGQGVEDLNVMIATNPDGVLQNLSMLSKEDQQTPPVIIEKMIDNTGWRLHDGMVDTTKIYLDPCCGRGGILAYLHKHYNVPKENLYGIDIKQENVTLCNKLGFNVIKGSALEPKSYIEIRTKIKKIKGDDMEINRVLMNPPFNKTLHLQILETVIKSCCENQNCEVTNISPANWLIDVKDNSRKTFDYVYSSMAKAPKLIDGIAAGKCFGISLPDGLAISTYSSASIKTNTVNDIIPQQVFDILNKIKSKSLPTLSNYIEKDKIDGWRVEVKPQLPTGVDLSHLNTDSKFHKQRGSKICPDISVFNNGYYKDGRKWFDTREKGKTYIGNEPLPCSLAFTEETSAINFHSSCHTNFYKNLVFMCRLNVAPRLELLPYMGDAINPLTNLKGYESAWTDEAFCKFFDLTKEESEFMCRKVDDYRVKDFINYINLDVE